MALSSCSEQGESVTAREPSVSIPSNPVGNSSSRQFITVDASGEWTLALDFAGQEQWAYLSPTSGEGYKSNIVLSWDKNTAESRSCTLILTCSGSEVTVVLRQEAASGVVSSDPVATWLELPDFDTEGTNMYFITHDMTISGSSVRNWSCHYSVDDKIALWVAYPLNSGLIGSGSRTNAWGYDPKLPSSYQPNLSSSYSGSYDRGHQLPSADRLASGANEATFYFTNMAPQEAQLNQNAWATLESKVRNWSKLLDTLYVVTGVDLNGSTLVAYDKDDNEITVPVGFYKALLGYKHGSSVSNSTGGYIGIAFYYEHRTDYGSSADVIMEQSMSIDELEAKLDMDFFVNLPSKVGDDIAATVESQVHSWWESN